MSIAVTCPCSRPFEAADDQGGKTIQCPECGRVMTVPGDSPIIKPIALRPVRSWKAVTALLLGVLSAGLWIYDAMPALVVGAGSLLLAVMAILEVRRSRGRLRGQMLALEGIAASIVGILLVGPCVDRVKETAAMTD